MISNFLQKIIYCPNCQKELSIKKDTLKCLNCQKQYLLVDNIPIFLDINLKKYKYLKNLPTENPFQYALHFWLYKKYIVKYLKPEPENIVLDIGCGLGHCLNFLTKFSENLVGLDIDLPSLIYAQKTTGANYVLGKGEKMPFKDNSFDKLISFNILEHIQNDTLAIEEIKRVGKNGATVLVMVPSLEGPRSQSKLKKLMHTEESENERHYRDGYYLENIKKLLNEKGIKVVRAHYTMFIFAELFTEFTKIFYTKKQKKYQRQTDLFKVADSKLFSIYKRFIPIIGKLALLEDCLFSGSKKGHALVIKGEIQK